MNFLENFFSYPEKQTASEQKENEKKEAESNQEKEPELEPLDPYTLSFRKEHIDVPELAGFDPEWELAEIKKIYNTAAKENREGERVILMGNFKKKLAEFRKNMSYAQQELEIFLRNNPDASQQIMCSAVDDILKKYQTQSQKEPFYKAVDKFYKARQAIKEVARQYQEQFSDNWQKELFNKLFGRLPKGKVAIDVMPINLYFYIYNIEDFILAFGGNEKSARNSGGGRLTYSLPIEELNGAVLIENSSIIKEERSATTHIHEEEHTIHDLYPRSACAELTGGIGKLLNFPDGLSLEDLRQVLKSRALIYLSDWQQRAKSEILAFLKESETLSFMDEWLLDRNGSGLYDFLNNWGDTDNFVKDIMSHGYRLKEREDRINENQVKEAAITTINKMWEQYKESISKSLNIIGNLLKKYGEEKRPAILRLLSQEPLNKWHRLNKLLS